MLLECLFMNKVYFCYQMANWCSKHHLSPISIMIKKAMRIIFSCDIHYKAEIGVGTIFTHDALGVVIHPKATIGCNCEILHGVTIGGRGRVSSNGEGAKRGGLPKIGNNVLIGCHAQVLGPIIIGDNVAIGAGSIVIHDVPANSVVVGNPARIVSKNEQQ